MADLIQAIGWLTVFIGGGAIFSYVAAFIAMNLTSHMGLGALAIGSIVLKVAAVVWIVLFFWLSPVTISFGVATNG